MWRGQQGWGIGVEEAAKVGGMQCGGGNRDRVVGVGELMQRAFGIRYCGLAK